MKKFLKFLKELVFRPELPEKKPIFYSELNYKTMPISDLLDLRYSKNTPVDELHKMIKVLRKRFPAGTTSVRNWGY